MKPASRVHRLRAYNLVLLLLATNIHHGMRLPVTHRMLAVHLRRAPAIVESEFPGYIENGYLPMILKRKPGRKPGECGGMRRR